MVGEGGESMGGEKSEEVKRSVDQGEGRLFGDERKSMRESEREISNVSL